MRQLTGSRKWFVLLFGWLAWTLASAELPASMSEPQFSPVGVGALPRGVVAALAQDQAGFLWIATGDGLVRYDGYRFSPRGRDAPSPAQRNLGWIRALLSGRDGRLWIGTESDGLALYDPATDRIALFGDAPTPAAPGGPRSETVRALAEEADGSLWVGSLGGGLARVDTASGRRTVLRRDGQPGSLPDDRVLALCIDRQGTLWVGTWAGLVKRARGSERFEPVLSAPGEPLAGRIVQALFEASDGRLWVGTQRGELLRVDPMGDRAELLTAQGGAVNSLVEAPRGQVWVGRSTDVVLHALSGAQQRTLRRNGSRPGALGGGDITALHVDQAGAVWVGGLGLGLHRHDPTDRGITLRGADAAPDSPLATASGRSLLMRDDGQLWVALQSGGVAVLDGQLKATGRVALPPQAVAAGVRVQAMAQAADGSAWLATGNHLFQLDRRGRPVHTLGHAAGEVHRLVVARDGRLWLCAEGGLYLLAPGNGDPRRLGPPGSVFTAAEAPDGSLWTGGAHGLQRVPPGSEQVLPVALAGGDGLGGAVVVGLLFDKAGGLWVDTAISGLHRLQTGPAGEPGRIDSVDRISARLGATGRPFGANLMADAAGRIWTQQHVYDPASDRLHELTEADGIRLGTGWFYSHARLPDGRLVFGGSPGLLVVRATNRSGLWSEHQLAVPVQVRPAWWQHPVTKLAAALVLLLGVAALVQLRTRGLRAQRAALEREVAERTAMLETSSLTDPLTGLHNRRFLTQRLPGDIADALRRHETHRRSEGGGDNDRDLVFFLIDIDHFKDINDEFGHHAGDTVLMQMRARLQQAFRQGDHLVRWGGEEFLIVARHTARERAAELAERVRAMVAGTPFQLDDGRQVVRSCSVGFAAFPLALEHPTALDGAAVIDLADAALYVVKRQGRNGWLGLLQAQADSAQTLREQARQPLQAWLASGALVTVHSPWPPGPAQD